MRELCTIERIRDALQDADLEQRFNDEINKAPAHELLHTFATWERIARNRLAVTRGNAEIVAREARGEGPAAGSTDITERILEEAARIRARTSAGSARAQLPWRHAPLDAGTPNSADPAPASPPRPARPAED